jgi:hypothetical protein
MSPDGPPNWLLLLRLYPAVPRICAMMKVGVLAETPNRFKYLPYDGIEQLSASRK